MQLQFCTLFSGSSGNSAFVGTERTKILIDAGVSGARIVNELRDIGVSAEALSAILVTHEHSDHIAGVGVLSRKYSLPVYATEGTWAAMRPKLGAIERKNQIVFEPEADFDIGDIHVQPFETSHDAAMPVGYALSHGLSRVAVATDTGFVREEWLNTLCGSDIVVLESNHDIDMLKAGRYPYDLKKRILGRKGHLSNDDAAQAAVRLAQSGTRVLLLGHLSHENNFPELAYQTSRAALNAAGLDVGQDVTLAVAPRDGHSDVYLLEGGA